MARLFTFGDYCKQRHGRRIPRLVFDLTNDGEETCTHRAKTGGCTYCCPKGYEVQSIKGGLKEQKEHAIKSWAEDKRTYPFYAYLQHGTPTSIEINRLIKGCDELLQDSQCVGLIIASRPDTIRDEYLEYLNEKTRDKDIWLEIGVQSSHNKTLESINRGHTWECARDAIKHVSEYKGIKVGVHVILGLPDEDRKMMLTTIKRIDELGIDAIKFHQLQIAKGTSLEDDYKEGRLRLLSMEEYIDIVVESIRLLRDGIITLRLVGITHLPFLVAPRWIEPYARVVQMIRNRLLYETK